MLSIIVPIAWAAVLSNPTPPEQNPSNEEIITLLYEQFESDAPKAYRLAQCESSDLHLGLLPKQFKDDGSPVTNVNKNGSTDTGIFQINSLWDETAKKLKLDYRKNWKHNILLAKIIYEKAGKSFKWWSCKSAL